MAYTLIPLCLVVLLCACEAGARTGEVNAALFGRTWLAVSQAAEPLSAPQIADDDPTTSRRVLEGGQVMVEWDEPRDVNRVVVRGPSLPDPKDVRLDYWHCVWPDNGSGGWARVDDPYRGKWVTVNSEVTAAPGEIAFKFAPLETAEIEDIKSTGHAFRRTYKLRLRFAADSELSEVEAYTGAVWKSAELRLEWQPKAKKPPLWKGRVEARNGHIVSFTPPKKAGEPALVKVDYSHSPKRLSTDRGFVVFRNGGTDSFSVFVDDVVREGGVHVRDIDAFVSDASKKLTHQSWKKPADAWDGTVMEKIAKLPEQSLEQVMKAIPPKELREAHLGVPNLRQEITISQSGNVQLWKASLRCPGRDLERRPWNIHALEYRMSTNEKPTFTPDAGRKVARRLEEGWLPVVHSEWQTGIFRFHKTAFATTLMDKIGKNEDARRGDEPICLLEKVEIANEGKTTRTAHLWIELTFKTPMKTESDGLILLERPTDGKPRPGLTPTRGRIDINGRGELVIVPDCVPAAPGSPDPDYKDSDKPREAIHYTVSLAPGETHTICLTIPYVECLEDAEIAALRSAQFDRRHAEVVDYWKGRLAASMTYEVPEPVLNDLWRSNLWHALITTDRDPATGLYEHFAATVGYNNYINETAMVVQSLEMRGEQKDAWRLLEPFAVCQGVKPLPGNFKTKDGCLYAAYPDPENDPYTAQGYNMHHGWGLWKLAEHYLYSRDGDYLASIAPKLVAACDWITRERQATKIVNPDGTRPTTWGLAPAGDLEDVAEYLYWYSTNAYYYVGMRTAAAALAQINHPEAVRIAKDAEDYKADILASIREETATSPVVKLKDGTYVPFVPPRVNVLTHLKEGWIREGLYPALHLLDGEILTPDDAYVTWILQDLEDNVFLSSESGYGAKDQLANFFSLGGFTLQPNLLPNSIAHLRRDEVPHFIRVFYNTFWASFLPDIVAFCEWVPAYGKSGGPLYKTPDESKFIQYMRYMLVLEEGDTLKLGMGVPRGWMADGKRIRIERAATFFGPMDMTITSHAAEGRIEANLNLPTRNRPAEVLLRLRHPDGNKVKQVTVSGKPWTKFEAERDLVRLPAGTASVSVIASY